MSPSAYGSAAGPSPLKTGQYSSPAGPQQLGTSQYPKPVGPPSIKTSQYTKAVGPQPPPISTNVSNGGLGPGIKVTWEKTYHRTANNNPTNLKYGSLTKKWIDSGTATLDPTEAGDGGKYLRFSNVADGMSAARDLLLSGPYSNLPVDSALQKWSDGAYKAVHLRLADIGSKKVSELSGEELNKLLLEMAHYESGFRASPAAITAGPRAEGR